MKILAPYVQMDVYMNVYEGEEKKGREWRGRSWKEDSGGNKTKVLYDQMKLEADSKARAKESVGVDEWMEWERYMHILCYITLVSSISIFILLFLIPIC